MFFGHSHTRVAKSQGFIMASTRWQYNKILKVDKCVVSSVWLWLPQASRWVKKHNIHGVRFMMFCKELVCIFVQMLKCKARELTILVAKDPSSSKNDFSFKTKTSHAIPGFDNTLRNKVGALETKTTPSISCTIRTCWIAKCPPCEHWGALTVWGANSISLQK